MTLRDARWLANVVVIFVLLVSAAATACPNCATTREVRAAFFDERFWSYLWLLCLPLLVLSGITAALYRIGATGAVNNAPSADEVRP